MTRYRAALFVVVFSLGVLGGPGLAQSPPSPLPEGFAQLKIDGVAIAEVAPDGPAGRAGLQGVQLTRSRRLILGDRIVAVDGKPVKSEDDLRDAFEAAGVGKTVTLTVVRDTARRQVRVPLVQID